MTRTKRPPVDLDHIDTEKAYSVSQVAHTVGWHMNHLRRLIRQGRVKAFKPNGYDWRIPGEEFERLLKGQEYRRDRRPKQFTKNRHPVWVIEVSEAQRDMMFPNWEMEMGKDPFAEGLPLWRWLMLSQAAQR